MAVDQFADENRVRGDGLMANQLAFKVADGVAENRHACKAFIPAANGKAIFSVDLVRAGKADGYGFLIRGQKINAEETGINDTAMSVRILVKANQYCGRIIANRTDCRCGQAAAFVWLSSRHDRHRRGNFAHDLTEGFRAYPLEGMLGIPAS